MRSGPKHEIDALRDEVDRLRSEALAGTGDAVQRWRRAQEIESRVPALRAAITRQRASNRASLEQALGQINSSLIGRTDTIRSAHTRSTTPPGGHQTP